MALKAGTQRVHVLKADKTISGSRTPRLHDTAHEVSFPVSQNGRPAVRTLLMYI